MADIYYQEMTEICRCTRNMGLNRTRGMGEVKVSFEEKKPENQIPEGFDRIEKQIATETDKCKTYRLDYRLKLQESVILKSPDRGQEKTLDYIEGNKILGVLAGRMGNSKYQEITKKKNMICSNLYITDTGERYDPAPASLRTIKDDDSGKVYDLAYGYETGEQTKSLGNSYIRISDDKIRILKVNTQIKNHHSRPEDKSIGYARGQGEGDFYQLSGIMAGQIFAGYILADKGQMKEILKTMKNMRNFEIGYGSAAEYGKVELSLCKIEEYAEKKRDEVTEFIVLLMAPVILYNEAGMYTQDVNILAKEISQIIGKTVVPDMQKLYLKYTMIGGWQSMWGKPKQTAWVLDKGTTILMRTRQGEKVNIEERPFFVGERTMEGYGEIAIDAKKYDYEVIEYGSGILYLQLCIWETEKSEEITEEQTEEQIKKMVGGIQSGDIRIGAQKNRGLGKLRIENIYRREFSEKNVKEWVTFDREILKDEKYKEDIETWCIASEQYTTIEVPLKLTGGLSIRKYSTRKDEPDFVSLMRKIDNNEEKTVIPGSSWKGAIRSRAEEIIWELGADKLLEDECKQIFGFVEEKANGTSIAKPAEWMISESILKTDKYVRSVRNSVSRFESATVQGALFTERFAAEGTTELEIKVRKSQTDNNWFIGLLLLVIRDIQNG